TFAAIVPPSAPSAPPFSIRRGGRSAAFASPCPPPAMSKITKSSGAIWSMRRRVRSASAELTSYPPRSVPLSFECELQTHRGKFAATEYDRERGDNGGASLAFHPSLDA